MKKLILIFAILAAPSLYGQICSTGQVPVTVNSTWSMRGCAAQSAGAGTGSAISCGSGCHGWQLSLVHDVAINVGDTIASFCDEDGTVTGAYGILVIDNALGSGTVNTVNSGGNTTITKATGSNFTSGWVGGTIVIAGLSYPIITFTDSTHIAASGNAGTQTGSVYMAGNLFTKLPQTDFNFANTQSTTFVIGNEFYLLGSAYAVASGYTVGCWFTNTTGSVGDMDSAFTVFRQPSGLASAGLQASSSWKQATSSGSGTTCGGNTCYLEATTNAITVGANNLVLGIQQQNNAPMPGSFSVGTMTGLDNDGTTNAGAAFAGWYYTTGSNTAAAGSVTATMYSTAPGDGYAIGSLAFAPSGPPAVYIGQSSAGSGNGSSCSNQEPVTYFNNASNWSATPAGIQIGPGSTVHLCGTITSTLTMQGDGASGNPVTIVWETGAKLSQGGASLINANGKDWITLDGGTPCGWIGGVQVACNGIVENTLNGTPGAACLGGPCSLQNNITQIDMNGGTPCNWEIKNLLFQDAYLHTSPADTTPSNVSENVIYASGVCGAMKVSHNVMHDCSWCLRFDSYATGFSLEANNNDTYRNDHDFAIGGTGVGPTFDLSYHDNHSGSKANWDAGGSYHHDGMHFTPFVDPANVILALIYNNKWDGDWGTDTTAYIFMESTLPNFFIFNNLGLWESNSNLTNGMLGQMELTAGVIVNNTWQADASIGHTGSCVTINGTNNVVENNAYSGCNQYINVDSGTIATVDYNIYGNHGSGGGSGWHFLANQANFAAWKAACSCDAHGIDDSGTTIGIDSQGVPQSGSAVIGVATNLTGLGITQLDFDRNGVARPASGAWDAGAYKYAAPPPTYSITSSGRVVTSGRVVH